MAKLYLRGFMAPLMFAFFIFGLISCGISNGNNDSVKNNSQNNAVSEKSSYLSRIENENKIFYYRIDNQGAYIPSMCYTKTIDENNNVHNPCYSCHTVGVFPNSMVDTELQEDYDFPEIMLVNPYKNLFEDRRKQVSDINTVEMYNYIRKSNYFDSDSEILLKKTLPKDWTGYIPDCYFNFDSEGFDINPKTGEYSGWRAFRYYPFLGTFWPTNGSTDDVMIRLPKVFMKNEKDQFDKKIWIANLNIIEALIKQSNVKSNDMIDEKYIGLDLDNNSVLEETNIIIYRKSLLPVGKAKIELQQGKLFIEPGLFPVGTEFLHTVRYIDWDETQNQIKMSERMKEVRYAKKEEWYSSYEIKFMIERKLAERNPSQSINPEPQIEAFPGDFEKGMKNNYGWRYSGYIEDKNGNLRPQTNEETLFCMGCHDTIGATTDTTFSFKRKFEWGYWTKNGLKGIKEPVVNYAKYGKQQEYAFYLMNNKSGNEFRTNDEVVNKFFNSDGTIKSDMLELLKNDISILLYPSKERAELLNKNYMVIVKNQSYKFGRDANAEPLDKNVYRKIEKKQSTGIKDPIF